VSYSAKVLWGEGLFLRPQHFQRQDAYHESRLHEVANGLHPYCWGVRNLRFDTDALANGVLRATELTAIFADGELYGAPHTDPLPPPITLDTLPAGVSEFTFLLALAPLRSFGRNYGDDDNTGLNARFVHSQVKADDLFTDAESADIAVLKKSVRLLADSEPHDAYSTLPLVRIKRTAMGGFEFDESFVPPSLAIRSSNALFLQLRRLMDVLQAKVNALYGFHREPSKNIIEFRSGDVASFWLLHTTSAAFASLSHLLQHPALHPERLFQQLLSLAGSLMTFSKSFVLSDLPVYSHEDPGPAFARLDYIIRELLETVISTRYFAIALHEAKQSYWLGRLESGKINEHTTFYLGISASLPAVQLVETIPQRFKVGGPDDVEKLVLSAMPGIKLSHAPQVPAAIPVKPGTFYFAVEPRGALYERMLKQQSVMIYAPSGVTDLKLELLVVTQ
jgi:type VI secretion system protein ImpJ